MEKTPEEHVAAMVDVFREVRRVLRGDGTCWVNYGDCYAHGQTGGGGAVDVRTDGRNTTPGDKVKGWLAGVNTLSRGLKPKDLVGMPWRVAFALQADGWWLRSDIIWHKPNPMPESVTDRPTKAHEYVFLLTRAARYYYDADAVREAAEARTWHDATGAPRTGIPGQTKQDGHGRRHAGFNERYFSKPPPETRNLRTVWTIPTHPFPGAHFATFPPKLVEPCIKAGTSEHGVCGKCGAPWERVIERGSLFGKDRGGNYEGRSIDTMVRINPGTPGMAYENTTTGWRPTCEHDRESGSRATARCSHRWTWPTAWRGSDGCRITRCVERDNPTAARAEDSTVSTGYDDGARIVRTLLLHPANQHVFSLEVLQVRERTQPYAVGVKGGDADG
jgi:hypothetical protein